MKSTRRTTSFILNRTAAVSMEVHGPVITNNSSLVPQFQIATKKINEKNSCISYSWARYSTNVMLNEIYIVGSQNFLDLLLCLFRAQKRLWLKFKMVENAERENQEHFFRILPFLLFLPLLFSCSATN